MKEHPRQTRCTLSDCIGVAGSNVLCFVLTSLMAQIELENVSAIDGIAISLLFL